MKFNSIDVMVKIVGLISNPFMCLMWWYVFKAVQYIRFTKYLMIMPFFTIVLIILVNLTRLF